MKRVSQLDGIRGVAILLVLVWHYFNCQVMAVPKFPVVAGCALATSLAWSGVDLFFVLSGFLIAGILLDHRGTANFFQVFYLRRACRIFPLYFLLFALFLWARTTSLAEGGPFFYLFRKPMPLWSYATFTQNIFMGLRGEFGAHWLDITWSLAVEEQFYLVVPLLIYFLPRRALVCVLVVAILSAPILRSAVPWFRPFQGPFVTTPWRSDSLLSGALLAVCVRYHGFVALMRQNIQILTAVFLTLIAGTVILALRPDRFGVFDHFWLAGLYATFLLIAFVGEETLIGRFLRSSVLVWLGKLSYGIYMFHEVVSGLLHGSLRHTSPEMRSAADVGVTLLSLGITLVLAVLSFRYFESPFLRMGHRFQYLPKLPENRVPKPADGVA